MRNVVLYIATSIDGYIADKEGGVSWLEGDGSDLFAKGTYDQFIQSVDTIVMGYSTYHQIVTELSPNVWVYQGVKSYVLTHRPIPSTDDVVFTDEDLSTLINRLKNAPGKDIWICGGASIVNQLVKLNLIDMYTITAVPVILGEGIPLFTPHSESLRLQVLSTTTYNGFVETTYQRKKK